MPSKLNLKVGEKITVIDIVKGLSVKSANDAAVVAAEGLCGSVKKFCILMNKKAKNLGMRSTHFENPSGVPNKRQVVTARDIATLGMALYRDFPQYWHFLSEKSFSYRGTKHGTHCKILHWYKGTDGGKTGYTNDSGFNLLVSATKYNKSGESKRLFVVVMGGDSGKSRDFYAAKLMDRYLGDYKISSSRGAKIPDLKKAKKDLLKQVSKSEMIEQVIDEIEEVSIDSIVKSSNKSKQYFDELYQNDEDAIQIEEEIFIKPTKRHSPKKRSK
jgi:D-alanyl-D-alanine carboxypeptidase